MNKTGKAISLFFALIMLAGFMAGCGGNQSQPAGSTPAAATGDTASGTPAESPATDWPTKPVQITIPYSPGGDTDTHCRKILQIVEKDLGQPMVVTNMTGAGGSVATRYVKDSPNDGYNILFNSGNLLINELMGVAEYGYDAFETVAMVVEDNSGLFVVSGDSPYNTFEELIEGAKANPNTLKYSTETGAFTHLEALSLQEHAGIELNIVDVGGTSQALAALISGQVDISQMMYISVQDYIAVGDVKPLAVIADERLSELPDVPTCKELGIDMSFPKFFCFWMPKDAPEEVVEVFSAALERAVASDEYQEYCAGAFVDPKYLDSGEAVRYLAEQKDTYFALKDKIEEVEKVEA